MILNVKLFQSVGNSCTVAFLSFVDFEVVYLLCSFSFVVRRLLRFKAIEIMERSLLSICFFCGGVGRFTYFFMKIDL